MRDVPRDNIAEIGATDALDSIADIFMNKFGVV